MLISRVILILEELKAYQEIEIDMSVSLYLSSNKDEWRPVVSSNSSNNHDRSKGKPLVTTFSLNVAYTQSLYLLKDSQSWILSRRQAKFIDDDDLEIVWEFSHVACSSYFVASNITWLLFIARFFFKLLLAIILDDGSLVLISITILRSLRSIKSLHVPS